MVFVETSFPRGGAVKTPKEAAVATPDIEFGAATFKRKKEKLNKKQRDEKHIRENELRQENKVEAVSAELLNLKTISEGMLIMGCISKIDATHVQVSLPGRLTGRVLITAMAPSYVNLINKYVNDESNEVEGYKSLEEMFTIGQVVCVKVVQIQSSSDKSRLTIELSMNPADLQVDFQHSKITAQTILVAAVEGIEDHGYVLATGIPNLRAFLPTAAVSSGELGVGEIIFCRVTSSKPSAAASTVICAVLDVLDRNLSFSKDSPNLSHVLPSSIVKFKVTKQLKDGIQGLVMNDTFTAYVNEHQLQTPISSPEDYEVDSVVDARVLYVMPLTKLVYLSLNLCETIDWADSELKVGTIIEQARVTRIGTGGLVMRLGKRHKGLVSFKSLRIGYKSNFDTDDLMAKYHKNSVHRVRITSYDPMDSLYVCTNNEKLLSEKYFVPDDVQVGDYVHACIDHQLADGGYFVRVGQIKGYLEKVQISTSTPASKLVDKALLRCRVLRKNVKDNKIFLTNRKEFMSEDTLLLKSYDKATVGLVYHGMITNIFADGYLVTFCQYVKGMLYRRNLNEADANAAAYYQVGQILKFRVMFARNHNITLALSDFLCQTGTSMVGKVATTSGRGLEVTFSDSKFNGIVPPMLMTDFPSLSPAMYQTFKSGEVLNVLCVARNVYSFRDVDRVREQPIRHWDDVRVGDILPAFVKDVKGDVVELMCLIEQYTRVVKCHVKMLLEDYTRNTQLNLVAEQLLFVRVMGKNEMLKTLTVSTRLSHVWQGHLKTTVALLKRFFADYQRIQKHFQKKKNPLASYNAGDRIKGKVVDLNANGATIQLANNVTGIVSYANTAEKPLEVNAKVNCLIIWVDFVQNLVYLTAIPELVNRSIPKRDANAVPLSRALTASRSLRADVLLVLDDVAILYPQKVTPRFIYVPTRFHHNDLQPLIMDEYTAGSVANVTTISVDDDHIIGMFENIRYSFDRLLPNSALYQKLQKRRQTAKLAKIERKTQKLLAAKKEEKDVEDEDEEEEDDEDQDDDNEHVDVKLEYSNEASITADNDDVYTSQEYADDQDLFFEDIFGGHTDHFEVKLEKNAHKRKNASDTTLNAAKRAFIKLEQLDGTTDVAGDASSDEEFDVKPVKQSKNKINKNKRTIEHASKPVKLSSKLPGASNFWTSDLAALNKIQSKETESDSDEEHVTKDNVPAKKIKLSTADRFRLARTEEARVRSVEETNANEFATPSTVDHFERLVMATPNSSLAWINYMVFHMQSNEFHRARLVARKAFKKISFRDGEELFNVWLALLNLELRYGDKDTFDAVLAEALQVNEPFKVYARCLQMLVSVSKVEELTDMILTFTKKFRSNPDCWSNAASAFFEVGLPDKAQPLLNRALSSLPERDHVSTIVKFASLNNKHNQRDKAHALMEQILSSYPKRVDCWSQYVDMLVKDKEIPIARQILERAISQKIPMKKMRTLFKKYLDFEERFGDGEAIQKVKSLAAQYVDAELKA